MSNTGRGMDIASTTSSVSARRRPVKFTGTPKELKRFRFLLLSFVIQLFWLPFADCGELQSLGIKGKMIAKKNYAEKAQMKKT